MSSVRATAAFGPRDHTPKVTATETLTRVTDRLARASDRFGRVDRSRSVPGTAPFGHACRTHRSS